MHLNVLLTKQHAYPDVSFGILASKIALAKIFPKFKFENSLSSANDFFNTHPEVNSSILLTSFERANELYNKSQDFTLALGKYLEEKGYPVVEQSNQEFYFDEKEETIVPLCTKNTVTV